MVKLFSYFMFSLVIGVFLFFLLLVIFFFFMVICFFLLVICLSMDLGIRIKLCNILEPVLHDYIYMVVLTVPLLNNSLVCCPNPNHFYSSNTYLLSNPNHLRNSYTYLFLTLTIFVTFILTCFLTIMCPEPVYVPHFWIGYLPFGL